MFKDDISLMFVGAFNDLLSNFENFVKICWAWYAVIFAFGFLFYFNIFRAGFDPSREFFFFVVLLAVTLMAGGSTVVAWSRCLILGEAPRSFHLKFGARELVCLLKSLLILAVAIAPMVIVLIFAALAGVETVTFMKAAEEGVLSWLFAFSLFITMPVVQRLSLVLPATALGEKLSFGTALRHSDGLGLPMGLAEIGIWLIVAVISEALDHLILPEGDSELMEGMAGLFPEQVMGFVAMALYMSVLIRGYSLLRERQAKAAQDAQPLYWAQDAPPER